jgi:hypothetical protein
MNTHSTVLDDASVEATTPDRILQTAADLLQHAKDWCRSCTTAILTRHFGQNCFPRRNTRRLPGVLPWVNYQRSTYTLFVEPGMLINARNRNYRTIGSFTGYPRF